MSQKSQDRHESPLVSVIIPVFNGETYLRRCIDSVLQQTMEDFELVVVDDGSTDSTADILREYAENDSRMRVLRQTNGGQGQARNRAIDQARGKYLLFVDADDFIERVTLQVVTERAEQDQADLVHFDWKFIRPKPDHLGQFDYYNIEPFWHLRTLEGEDCEQLFRMHSYFSVTNLYRRSFLNEYGIRYEEGQIYEDNPFLAQVFSRAQLVSLVHSPLYAIQANPNSSTKQGSDTPRHMQDHLAAVRQSFEKAELRTRGAAGDLAEYHLEKFSIYYARRVPKQLRAEYAKQFVELLGGQELPFLTLGRKTSWLTRLCVKLGVFERQRPAVLQRLIEGKNAVTPAAKKAIGAARKTKRRLRHPLRTFSSVVHGRSPQLKPGTILFLGFDHRYTGNSRALYEELLGDARFADREILFATVDTRVDAAHRVRPESLAFTRAAQQAEFVIAETWIPASVPKHPNSTWIQLWHGTPIKRMLFDSHEREITKARPTHKVNKYKDIQRWDFFVVDGSAAAERFSTAFLLPVQKVIFDEYPRVTRLKQRLKGDSLLSLSSDSVKSEVREGRFVVLYAPTWRDYNYGLHGGNLDLSYQLDVKRLSRELGRDFRVLFKDHDYLQVKQNLEGAETVDANGQDIEDLLLGCNVVVSDYSSVLFDAAAIGRETILYSTDTARFQSSRGIYSDFPRPLCELSEVAAELRRLRANRAARVETEVTASRRASPRVLEILTGVKNAMSVTTP